MFQLIDDLVTIATDLGEPDQDYVEAKFLAGLDALVQAIYGVLPEVDSADADHDLNSDLNSDLNPDLKPDEAALRSVIKQRFPRWRTYNTVYHLSIDIGDTELAVADAIDDITAIISELMVVRAARTTNDNAALWLLLDGYYNFWRGPLRSLQLFIHYLDIESENV